MHRRLAAATGLALVLPLAACGGVGGGDDTDSEGGGDTIETMGFACRT